MKIHINDLAIDEIKMYQNYFKKIIDMYGEDFDNMDINAYPDWMDRLSNISEVNLKSFMIYALIEYDIKNIGIFHPKISESETATEDFIKNDGIWVDINDFQFNNYLNKANLCLIHDKKIRAWFKIRGYVYNDTIRYIFRRIYNEDSLDVKAILTMGDYYNHCDKIVQMIINAINSNEIESKTA